MKQTLQEFESNQMDIELHHGEGELTSVADKGSTR